MNYIVNIHSDCPLELSQDGGTTWQPVVPDMLLHVEPKDALVRPALDDRTYSVSYLSAEGEPVWKPKARVNGGGFVEYSLPPLETEKP